jgi:anti-sigma regulatory factor (Ser/Thr protein kinase)
LESERENITTQRGAPLTAPVAPSHTKSLDESFSYAYVNTRARIALYDDLLSAPRIIDIEPAAIVEFIENIATQTYDYAQKQGGSIPYSVIREIAENFIHARFKECTVSVLDSGNTIRFSDQGPGIEKKRLVQQPGITSATAEMKRFIRGVGSGFPIVREYLEYRNGSLSIDDNAKEGTVITLSLKVEGLSASTVQQPSGQASASEKQNLQQPHPQELEQRELQTLHLLYDKGVLGPSDLKEPLRVSAATAHRVLESLDKKGLIESTSHRKRILSSAGLAYLESLEDKNQRT